MNMISNLILFLFGITLVGTSTIPVTKYVPNCKEYSNHNLNTIFNYLAIRKYSSGLNYYWNLLLDDDSLYVGGQ